MCGIAGYSGWEDQEAGRRSLGMMVRALGHRGPDGQQTWMNGDTGLGHTRLSIIDLSEAGSQPKVRGRLVLSFNGEIYNYREIRAELRNLGCAFSTESDSEVILAAWETWGEDCIDRLHGMFAMAVYDTSSGRLTLVRDRMGIKPVYYAQKDNGSLWFASEVRALMAAGVVESCLNRDLLAEYLMLQTTVSRSTLISDVNMLLPGRLLRFENGTVTEREYWRPDAEMAADPKDAIAKVREAVLKAVRLRLTGDVPVGAFLSGGIDSSLIVALMQQEAEHPVPTFTVSFQEDSLDGRYSQVIADRFGTRHTEITLSPDEVLRQVPDALDAMDHPSGDGINTWVVSKAVSETGLKVALSGLGGDEVFGGYSTFRRAARMKYLSGFRHAPAGMRKGLGALLRAVRPSVTTDKMAEVLTSDLSVENFCLLNRQFFSGDRIADLLGGAAPGFTAETILREFPVNGSGSDIYRRVTDLETGLYMQPVLLRDTDQMSMAHALEVRVPFLDHQLINAVYGLPDTMKRSGGLSKGLLLAAFPGVLPEEVIHRPKQGFSLPFDMWIRGVLRDTVRDRLAVLSEKNMLDGPALEKLWVDYENGDPRVTWSRIWLLAGLGNWVQKHHIS